MSSNRGLIIIIGLSPTASSISAMYGKIEYPTMFCGCTKMNASASEPSSPLMPPFGTIASATSSSQSINSNNFDTPLRLNGSA